MNGCKLASLERFPNLPKLVRLELIENEFDGDDLVHLSCLSVRFCITQKNYHNNRSYNHVHWDAIKLQIIVSSKV